LETPVTPIPTGPEGPAAERSEWKRVLLDLLETVGLALVLFLMINTVSARVRVDGQSMIPTLQNGEFVLVNRLAYQLGQPARGDIIVFRSVNQPDLGLIKRIVGLPGDAITIGNGRVVVNGTTLHEAYINAEPLYSGHWSVPVGYLFVLGDNRNNSEDSHAWGLLPIGNVVGKALLIYWPPPEWAMIDHVQIAATVP
jgi:signal peptidase I